jgi:tyrosine decarboxylase/aspartate 1-decarboxylase
MKFEKISLKILEKALNKLESGFKALPDIEHNYNAEKIEKIVLDTAEIMKNNYPYFHPYYAGQVTNNPKSLYGPGSLLNGVFPDPVTCLLT